MEIGNKIMKLRKKEGLSQEELSEKIGVTRQTISKWELGETYPDLNQAKKISKVFNVSLDELANNDIKEILVEKTSNTEKLAGIILKLLRVLVIVIIVFPILYIALFITVKSIREKNRGRLMDVSINCNLHDKTYGYEFIYYETTGEIKEAGGDGYLANITNVDKYSGVYESLDIIDAYVRNNGGSCTKSDPIEYNEEG